MKIHALSLLLLPATLAAVSCTCAQSSDSSRDLHPVGRAVTRTSGDANLYAVAEDDAAMDRATRQARQTVSQFITALGHPAAGQRDFQIKKLFIKNGEAEHIWLTDVHFNGNRFVGIVDNHPVKIAGLKIGDKVSVNPDEVSDWSYVQDGNLVGGYTIRVLYAELSPAERLQFEKQAGFHLAAQ